jgi:hypothetical protein
MPRTDRNLPKFSRLDVAGDRFQRARLVVLFLTSAVVTSICAGPLPAKNAAAKRAARPQANGRSANGRTCGPGDGLCRETALSIVLAPVVEDTVFGGYIYPVVKQAFGVAAGIVGTGTIFGLLHAEQLWGGWVQIALLVVVGVIFTWVRTAKRTVLASFLLHISYNSLVVLSGLHFLRH